MSGASPLDRGARTRSVQRRRSALRKQLRIETLEERRVMAYADTVLADNPVAYYRFEETSGTVAADSAPLSGVQNATFNNVTLGAPSATVHLGRAGDFTSSDLRITDGAPFDFGTGNFTIEMWFQADDANNRGDLFTYKGGGGDFGIHLDSQGDGVVSGYHNGFRLASPAQVGNGQWNHLVLARYGTGADETFMMINGQLVDTGAMPDSMTIANDLLVGRNFGGNIDEVAIPFNGRIDEVAIYNYGLPVGRAIAHYQAAFAADGVADSYTATEDVVLNVPAPGVLANDTGSGGPISVVPQTVTQPSQGTVTMNPDGSFTYDQNGAFNSLPQGATQSVSFTYQFVDSSGTAREVLLAPTGPGGTYRGYMLVQQTLTWDQARIAAGNFSFAGTEGHLITVTSWDEQQIAVSLARQYGIGETWIGLTDSGNISSLDGREPAPNATEGGNTSGAPTTLGLPPSGPGQRGFGWQWVTGEPLVFQNWNPGEPNGGTGESAAQMNFNIDPPRDFNGGRFSVGAWNDLPAGSTLGEGDATQPTFMVEFDINQPLDQIAQPGFIVRTYHASTGNQESQNNSGNSGLANSYAVINSGRAPTGTSVITLADTFQDGTGRFGVNNPVPGGVGDQFTVQVTGTLTVNTAGIYTFGTRTDDGARVRIDIDGDGTLEDVLIDDNFQGETNRIGGPVFLTAGTHAFEWVWFDGCCGASGEFFYQAGQQFNADDPNFILVGDPAQGISSSPMTVRSWNTTSPGGTGIGNPSQMDNIIDPNGNILRRGNGFNIGVSSMINYENSGGGGAFGNNTTVPGIANVSDNFAIQATGFVYIPAAGQWTFGVTSDDGFRLTIGGGATLQSVSGDTDGGGGGTQNSGGSLLFPDGRGNDHSLGVWNFPAAGFYPIELRNWEGGGGAAVELYAAQGALSIGNNADLLGTHPQMRLVGDVAGGGLLVLTNLSSPTTVTITVEGVNDAPVANAGAAQTIDEGQSVTFNAGASSDVDTGDTLTYAWDIDNDGQFDDATGVSPTISWNTLNSLGFDGLNPGVARTVRVQVTDNNGAATIASTTLTVNNAPPDVTIDGPALVGRGQPVTYTFSADDFASADDAAGFEFEIDWGDGQTETIARTPNNGVQSLQHVYPAAGNFTITVTATDKDNESGSATLDIVVSAVFVDDEGNVIVGGTNADDRIILSQGAGGLIVRINNKLYPAVAPQGGEVRVFGGEGNDIITVSTNVAFPMNIFGGEGNDYITGGNQADFLSGEDGNDRILGAGGADTILGGNGNDNLTGGAGNDEIYGDAYTDEFGDLQEGTGNDTINGGIGNDTLDGGEGKDRIYGGAGHDVLFGRGGADYLSGDAGNDLLLGGEGSDALYGVGGNDVVIGGTESDLVYGGDGADAVIGNDMDESEAMALYLDWLAGGSGDQESMSMTYGFSIVEDDAADTLYGQNGNDWIVLFLLDRVRDGRTADRIDRDLA